MQNQGPDDGPEWVTDPVARARLPLVVSLALGQPQPLQHKDEGEHQLGYIICIHDRLRPFLFLGLQFLVEHVPSLQDLLVGKGKQGDVLNKGRVAEAVQAVLHSIHQRLGAQPQFALMFADGEDRALDAENGVAVLVAVHGVLEGLQQTAYSP